MNKKKYLIKNTVIFAVGNISTKLISFLLIPIYTYSFTQSEYGTIDLIYTICTIIIPLVSLNISESILRFSIDNDCNTDNILSVGFIVILIGSILTLAIIPILRHVPIISSYSWVLYIYIVSSILFAVTINYLRGIEKLTIFSICSIIYAIILSLLSVFFIVILKKGLYGYYSAYSIANVTISITAIIIGKQYRIFKHFQLKKTLAVQMIKFSLALVPNSLLWWVTNSSDRIIITSMLGTAENGLYSIAYKIPSALTIISTIFSQAWLYSAIKEDNSERATKIQLHNEIFGKYFSFLVLLGGVVVLLLKPLLRVYVSESFYMSWEYSPFLILGYIFLSIATYVGTTYYVKKNSVGSMFSALCGALVNIILNIVLIPIFGVNGASIATCLSYFAVFIYRVIDTYKEIRIDLSNKKFILNTLLIIMMCLTIYYDTKIGYMILATEYLAIIFVNYRLLKDLINIFWKVIKNKVKANSAKQ